MITVVSVMLKDYWNRLRLMMSSMSIPRLTPVCAGIPVSTSPGQQGCDSLLNSVAEAAHWGEDDWDNMEVVIDKGDPTRVGLTLDIWCLNLLKYCYYSVAKLQCRQGRYRIPYVLFTPTSFYFHHQAL